MCFPPCVGDLTLGESLEDFGLLEISSLFTIEVDDEREDLNFPGWDSIEDGDSTFVLVQSNS
jgi:hypothetical protein